MMMTNKVVDFNGERTLEGLSQFVSTGGDEGASAKHEVRFSLISLIGLYLTVLILVFELTRRSTRKSWELTMQSTKSRMSCKTTGYFFLYFYSCLQYISIMTAISLYHYFQNKVNV